jgi:hypothetical protein
MSELWGSLFGLIERQSKPVQIAAALILVVCVGVPTGVTLSGMARKLFQGDGLVAPSNPPAVVSVATESTPYRDVRPLVLRGNYETPDSERASEQNVAADWHDKHSGEDSPDWAYIADGDRTKNFVKYRFFSKSDGCLQVVRSEHGIPSRQWIMNPAPRHRLHVDSGPAAAVEFPKASGLLAGLMNLLEPPVSAHVDTERLRSDLARPAAAQGGCLNPHPGTFQSWWGPPNDQCWSPMYRQFPDGCVHFQMYNRCANAWDQRINWTRCVH